MTFINLHGIHGVLGIHGIHGVHGVHGTSPIRGTVESAAPDVDRRHRSPMRPPVEARGYPRGKEKAPG